MWWSRLAPPALRSWTDPDQPLRLVEQTVAKDDPDPKALACYGLLVRWAEPAGGWHEAAWLRFVDGRPVSAVTTALPGLVLRQAGGGREGGAAAGLGQRLLARQPRGAQPGSAPTTARSSRTGRGVRILACTCRSRVPGSIPIEPKWVHGKRRVIEPDRLLSAQELADRVCAAFGCAHEPHLTISDYLA